MAAAAAEAALIIERRPVQVSDRTWQKLVGGQQINNSKRAELWQQKQCQKQLSLGFSTASHFISIFAGFHLRKFNSP